MNIIENTDKIDNSNNVNIKIEEKKPIYELIDRCFDLYSIIMLL